MRHTTNGNGRNYEEGDHPAVGWTTPPSWAYEGTAIATTAANITNRFVMVFPCLGASAPLCVVITATLRVLRPLRVLRG